MNIWQDFWIKPSSPSKMFACFLPPKHVGRNPPNACETARMCFLCTMINGGKCIICGCSGSKLAQWKDIYFWTTLYHAAVIRNQKPISEASTESKFAESTIEYHPNCRAEFTNRRDLQANNKPSDDAASGTAPRRSHRDGNQPNSAILPDQCLFFKKLKYKPNTKTREKLHSV